MSNLTGRAPSSRARRRGIGALLAIALAAVLAATLPAAATVGTPPAGAAAPAVLATTNGHNGVARELLGAWRQAQLGTLVQPRTTQTLGSQPVVTPSQSQIIGTPCGTTVGLRCADLVVPLDWSGATPGTVTLKVQALPSVGPERGVIFLIAGGPGQGSASVFGLDDPGDGRVLRLPLPRVHAWSPSTTAARVARR